MVNITPKKRSRIIALAEHTEYSHINVASLVGVSQKPLSRITKEHAETGSFTLKHKGRKRRTTSRDHAFVIRNSKLDPKKSSFDLQKDLQLSRVQIRPTTARRRLLDVGRKTRKFLEKQLLTKAMKQKRLTWAKK